MQLKRERAGQDWVAAAAADAADTKLSMFFTRNFSAPEVNFLQEADVLCRSVVKSW